MKQYFVRVISTGTEANPNFAGEVRQHLIGKGGRLWGYNLYNYVWDGDGWTRKYYAEEYIRKDIQFESENPYGHFWKTEYEIVEGDFMEGGALNALELY